jgi:hypothetical protein
MQHSDTQEQAKKTNRNSTLTTFSLPETIMSSPDLGPESLSHITISRETPIILHKPNSHQQASTLKPWVPKVLMALLVVLILALALAIVLIVMASLGYLGKSKVEAVQMLQPTVTATIQPSVKAQITGASGGIHAVVRESGGGRVVKRVGIIVCEVVLAWSLVYLFGKFENRESGGEERWSVERRDWSRTKG